MLGSVFHKKVSRIRLSVHGLISLSGFFLLLFFVNAFFINTVKNYNIFVFFLQDHFKIYLTTAIIRSSVLFLLS